MLDTIVIFIFSVFILLVGITFSRTGRNLKSFFAGGEAVPWTIGGLSLFMSFFSSGTFVAWGSIAYQHGWVAITIQWTMCIGAIITGMYLAPKWKAMGNLTAAEFIKERLGLKVQQSYIYIFTFVSLFIKGSVLYAVARLVGSSLDFPLAPTTVVLGILMISYTAVGGLWAVMVTDILQFVILTAAVLLLIPLVFNEAGGFQQFMSKTPEGFFDITSGDYTWGFIAAFALYHVFYIGGNWTFVQRYTSTDKPASASKVAYLFAALYLLSPILWMLPPMVYKTINPGLTGMETENAYLMVCKQVLPAGLMGLILTGMYFSTSASANTALNVVSAVFTNDIYKGKINPGASDEQLMKVARRSSWIFGFGMIVIALIVPLIGGLVEFTLSVGAITGGPLLAPPIWALFSKRLNGKATLWITIVSLSVNLFAKMIMPVMMGYKLSRENEFIVGVGLPTLLLLMYELYARSKGSISHEYKEMMIRKTKRKEVAAVVVDKEEEIAVKKQNRFGLRMIAFSLAFIAILLYLLCFFTVKGTAMVAGIATVILFSAIIPLRASRKVVIPLMLLLWCSAVQARQDPDEAVFKKPAANQYKPLTWWHWINGNVTKDGIRKDLVDMKEKGIGGVQLFDTHMYLPAGPVRYGTRDWYDHVRFAMALCDSLGLEFYMVNSPGWSGSGGPWVRLEQSMKKLVFTEVPANDAETIVPEPGSFKGFYKDVAILAVRAVPKLEALLQRNGMTKMPLLPDKIPLEDTSNALQANDIVDVSRYFNNNKLSWKPPKGNWLILRFGYTSTGKTIHPAVPEGSGYEVDKLDTAAVAFQFEQTTGRMIREAGEYTGKTFKGILFDSFEGGFQNWTETMPFLFRQLKGYDCIAWLPVLAGRMVQSEKASYAFLWDFHDALTRLFAQNYYGTMQKLAHRHGLKIFVEGQGGPMSPAYVNVFSDVPMNEFWTGNTITNRANQIKQTVSIAHVLGKNIVAAESFTSTPENGKWQNTPYRVKRTGDYAFVYGINKFIFHTYTHQPFDLKPGFTMGRYGMHFGRTNTWWPYAGAWIDYISRCQYLLQMGNLVTDICLLFPRDAVYEFLPNMPAIPEGYNYAICYPDYLQQAKWINNRLVFPSGASYRLLVLPDYGYMTYATLKEIYRLAMEGCTIKGPLPKAMPDRGQHQKEFDELLGKLKRLVNNPLHKIVDTITADFQYVGADTVKYVHRKTNDADIYFVSNQTDSPATFQAFFRVTGKQPELWDPVTGSIQAVDDFKVDSITTCLNISLASSGSVFVVFKNKQAFGKKQLHNTVKKEKPVNGKWNVEFLDGTPFTITMPELVSWSAHTNSNIRYYSGRAAYTNYFEVNGKYKTIQLDLGNIADIGEVILNGQSAGVVWTPPYTADITAFVKPGRNELRIMIANRWINRLIGDENIPVDYVYDFNGSKFTNGRMAQWPEWMYDRSKPKNDLRYSFTTWKHYDAGDKLVESGLLGPVKLVLY